MQNIKSTIKNKIKIIKYKSKNIKLKIQTYLFKLRNNKHFSKIYKMITNKSVFNC